MDSQKMNARSAHCRLDCNSGVDGFAFIRVHLRFLSGPLGVLGVLGGSIPRSDSRSFAFICGSFQTRFGFKGRPHMTVSTTNRPNFRLSSRCC